MEEMKKKRFYAIDFFIACFMVWVTSVPLKLGTN